MLAAVSPMDAARFYDRIAPVYDRRHRRWLRYAGGEAQAALEAAVRVALFPGAQLLDAGCGTGAFARRLLRETGAADVTLLDPSEAMLARTADLPVARRTGRLESLPFDTGRFDIVTCAWALETVPDPARAMAELTRVVTPGGLLCLAFCADRPAENPLGWSMRQMISRFGAGRFLCPDQVFSLLTGQPGWQARHLPCRGPAAALIGVRETPSLPNSRHCGNFRTQTLVSRGDITGFVEKSPALPMTTQL